jgi:hypothetical protein
VNLIVLTVTGVVYLPTVEGHWHPSRYEPVQYLLSAFAASRERAQQEARQSTRDISSYFQRLSVRSAN